MHSSKVNNSVSGNQVGRPEKYTVDYFQHDCIPKKTLHILESNFKNDGYAVWYKLLERLGTTDHHVINLNDPVDAEYIASKMNIDSERLFAILDLCSKLSAIDKRLWEKKIVWCQNFVDRLSHLYNRRSNPPPKKPSGNALEALLNGRENDD